VAVDNLLAELQCWPKPQCLTYTKKSTK